MSTEGPNLQCCPKQWPECPAPGEFVSNMRASFVASRGNVLLAADYRQARTHNLATGLTGTFFIIFTSSALLLSKFHTRMRSVPDCVPISSCALPQLEFRIMTHFSGEEKLIRVFSETGGGPEGDPFKQLAAQWKGVPAAAVTPEDRQWAKAITYGMLYGKGDISMAEDMERTPQEVRKIKNEFDQAYPRLLAWRKKARRVGRLGLGRTTAAIAYYPPSAGFPLRLLQSSGNHLDQLD